MLVVLRQRDNEWQPAVSDFLLLLACCVLPLFAVLKPNQQSNSKRE